MGCVGTSRNIKIKDKIDVNDQFNLNHEDNENKIKTPEIKLDSESITKKAKLSNNNMIYNESPIRVNSSIKTFMKDASEIDDKYFILEKLSKNPISTNYKIQSKENSKIFKNMKVITKSSISENDDEKKILKEIEILQNLKHENIIQVEECYGDDKCYYVITEHSDFGSLKDQFGILKKYSENQTKFIMFQLLQAIKYLNENNFIHTDVKPENILINGKFISNNEEFFHVKLIDFGSVNSLINIDNNNLPYYIAPEIIERKINAKCDIWSIGIIMFRLLFGNVPFRGSSFDEIIDNIKNSPIEFNLDNKNIISEDAENLLFNMLNRDVDKRYDVNTCIQHTFFKNNLVEENKKKITNNEFNNNEFVIKTQFDKSKMKGLVNTGLYKVKNYFQNAPKKLKTISDDDDKNRLFLSSLLLFIDYYIKINYKQYIEEQIINDIYQKNENRDLSEIDVSKIYNCTIKYVGMINYSVRYIAFKEKIKDDIKIYFKNEKTINFGTFKTFLIREKENLIENEFCTNFDKLEKKNKEEIESFFELDNNSLPNYEIYINAIKEELIPNKIYTYEKFKLIVKKVIDKINETNNNKVVVNSNINNIPIFEKIESINKLKDDEKSKGEEFENNHNLNGIVIFKKKNSKLSENRYILNKIQNKEKKENNLKEDNSFDTPKKNDPNAFDPQKFLLFIDRNYLTN